MPKDLLKDIQETNQLAVNALCDEIEVQAKKMGITPLQYAQTFKLNIVADVLKEQAGNPATVTPAATQETTARISMAKPKV